jgi:hypothetical protein
MKPTYYAYLAVLLILAGLSVAVRIEHAGKVKAEQALVVYKAQVTQAAADQIAENKRKQKIADQQAKDAEAQREKDSKDHQHIIDTLTARVRALQSALSAGNVQPPMAHPGPVEGGPPGSGQAGGVQPPVSDLVAAATAAAEACIGTYDDKWAIIRAEPAP